jgi:hypothetical protein
MAHPILDAKNAAIELVSNLSYSVGADAGLRIKPGTWEAATHVAAAVLPIDGSRQSPGNLPLDFLAPSVWHAACFLMATYLLPRITRTPFSDDPEIFESFFGNASVYRGQARGWNIVPTAWRSVASVSELRHREILLELLESYMGPDDAIEFDLFGRVRSQAEADALAQHYGMPTNLVDFTFNPMVALSFACAETSTGSPGDLDSRLSNCGVVYFISFVKLCMAGTPKLAFPPVQAERLFKQAGFFVDYGARPTEIPAVLDYEQSWMWLQQNCARIFFPRNYPRAIELDDFEQLLPDLLTPEAFFQEVIAKIRELPPTEMSLSTVATVRKLRRTLQTRPAWRVKDLDQSFIYTDDELVRVARYLEYYIRVATLLEMNRHPHLDPVILGKLGEFDASGLKALKQIASLPYGFSAEALKWIVAKIPESLRALNNYMAVLEASKD